MTPAKRAIPQRRSEPTSSTPDLQCGAGGGALGRHDVLDAQVDGLFVFGWIGCRVGSKRRDGEDAILLVDRHGAIETVTQFDLDAAKSDAGALGLHTIDHAIGPERQGFRQRPLVAS